MTKINIKQRIIQKIKYKKGIKINLKNYHNKHDLKENKESEIPNDEKVRQHCIWLMEVYNPDSFNNLISNLNKLGWKHYPDFSNDERLSEIIQGIRLSNSQCYYNLGYILPHGNPSFLETKESRLPNGVKYISISLLNVLTSTIIITFQFRFDEIASCRLEYPINKKYSTYIRKINNGTQYITPFHQKQEALKKLKNEIVSECKLWIKNNLGGFYTSNEYLKNMPYYEFITLDKKMPYTKSKFSFDYLRLLDLDYAFDVWSCDEVKGIYLKFSDAKNDSCPVVQLAGRMRDILENFKTKLDHEKTIESVVNDLEYFGKTLSIFCIYYLQKFYKNQVFQIRDDIGNIKIKNIKKSSNNLKKIADKFATLDTIIPFYENDLLELCNNNNNFLFDTYIFKRINRPDLDIQLFNKIRIYLINDANLLMQVHNNLRQSFITISNIINSISNDKVSKANLRTQIVIIILSAIVILLTDMTLLQGKSLLNTIINFIHSLF